MQHMPKKSLYAQYISERENKHIVEDERGFATYILLPEGIYIEDIFVAPQFRNQDVASSYADAITSIAQDMGLKKLFGSVSPKANGATASLKVLLAYGFKLDSCNENLIYFIKEL